MEDLNKNQIVLLTVLISFITSIATGIMTVSLLQEAPLEITRNINRIVEKTIETVTTPPVVTPGQKEVTTVIVKEEDLILDSINKNIKSIVRIEKKDGNLGTVSMYGLGLIINKDGTVVTDRKTIDSLDTFTLILSDDTKFPLIPVGVDKQTNFILFKPNVASTTKVTFTPATFSEAEPKLGQTLISVGGDERNAVAIGRVLSLITKDQTVGSTTTKSLSSIETDLSTKDLLNGSPLFNLNGDVIGMKISAESSKSFIPVSILRKDISTLSEASKTP